VERLRDLLDEAVRSRLVSDVPLGIFLSGGIDSSAIAALAARHGALDTFTIGFEESSFDERSYAGAVAQRLGSRHHELVLSGDRMPELVPRIGGMLDEPLGDASIIPTTLLSGFARQRVTVALGGDGGDELFGGYPMHQAHRVAPFVRRLPTAVIRLLESGARMIPVSHRNFSFGFKTSTFLRGAAAPPPLNHALWMSSFSPSEQPRLLTPDVLAAAGDGRQAFAPFETVWKESEAAPPGSRARHLDSLTYLPGDILTKVDRASMSVSLEVRAPFLAPDVVAFAFSLPDSYHMRGLTGKRLLRGAMADLLPRQVLTRPKKGFGIPVGRWLNGPLRELTDDLLSADALASEGLFEPGEVQRRLREHRAGRRDHRKPLWTLLVFELWRRAHLR
jgi:asparagine synthase (glutamine-hydrolysing)